MAVRDRKTPCLDLLRHTRDGGVGIIEDLDRLSCRAMDQGLRRAERYSYREDDGLILEVHHHGGQQIDYLIRPRNLSNTGIGFIHGGFLHQGTPCVVILKTIAPGRMRVAARVARCRHVEGKIHEVGLEFVEPIDLGQILLPDQLHAEAVGGEEAAFAEAAVSVQLTGPAEQE
jgi:hypothetical protein